MKTNSPVPNFFISALLKSRTCTQKKYAETLTSPASEFNKHFRDFAAIETEILLFTFVFTTDLDQAPENLKLELIEFRATTSSATDYKSFSRVFLPATGKQVSTNTRTCKKNNKLVRLNKFM